MKIQDFFDPATWTYSYIVFAEETRDAIVIDPVLDYNPVGSIVSYESVDRLTDFLHRNNLQLRMILETHAHADHLSSARILKERFPQSITAIGEGIILVQKTFAQVFNMSSEFTTDGRQFDRLLKGGETVEAGSLRFKVLATPGHTPACVSYLFGNCLFTGDALFLPDIGVGRCDFPEGSAKELYRSVVEKIFSLPEETRIYVGHDYPPASRGAKCATTVAVSRETNKDLRASMSEEQFVAYRESADSKLQAPRLLYQSLQVNINAGSLPKPHLNGVSYLLIPINKKD